MTDEIINYSKILWDYQHVNHELNEADCIFVLGSHDIRVAERAAELYLKKMAPVIIFSGGLGNLTEGVWDEPEADIFSKIAINMGVPKEAILIENKSTNTGENVRFSYELMKINNVSPKKMILVQKPYMERRTYATFKKQWPGDAVEIFVTSPQLSFDQYPNDLISMEDVTNIMVGDLQRIKLYSAKGFQIPQEIPDHVWNAYLKLVEAGYTSNMLSE